jgi:undecaprenyl-diphosphatase
MIESITALDTDLFLFLNGIHNSFFDTIMYWVSHKFFWIPFYIFLIYLLFRHYGLKTAGILTAIILVTFTLTNTLSVEAFKNVFERPRPCHNELISSQVHLIDNHCGGKWGFVSSHASNVFGLAMLIFILLRKKIKRIGFWIFFWAAAVSYSRIYLGVHYPLDLVCGALLGILVALIAYGLAKQFGLIKIE